MEKLREERRERTIKFFMQEFNLSEKEAAELYDENEMDDIAAHWEEMEARGLFDKEYKYTNNIKEASTFRSRYLAQEAIAELDDCEVGTCRNHEVNFRGDGKIVLKYIDDSQPDRFFADDIGNRYSSKLND